MRPRQILSRLRDRKGQALIEFLFILPLVLLLILNLVNFGGFFYAWITVINAAREGANYAILGTPSAGAPNTPSGTQIVNLITSEMASLPNSGSVSVNACSKFGTAVTPITGTCSLSSFASSDPESAYFIITSVKVTYTYVPFIQGFTFPNLGVYLTIPPTTVSSTALMRSYQ